MKKQGHEYGSFWNLELNDLKNNMDIIKDTVNYIFEIIIVYKEGVFKEYDKFNNHDRIESGDLMRQFYMDVI